MKPKSSKSAPSPFETYDPVLDDAVVSSIKLQGAKPKTVKNIVWQVFLQDGATLHRVQVPVGSDFMSVRQQEGKLCVFFLVNVGQEGSNAEFRFRTVIGRKVFNLPQDSRYVGSFPSGEDWQHVFIEVR